MSGTSLSEGARLIQIAVVGPIQLNVNNLVESDFQVFNSTIALELDAHWSTEAESIHGITQEEALSGREQGLVDEELEAWLQQISGTTNRRRIVPVGFNVGSFDMKFIKKFLPKSYTYFTRRSVDLNGVCFSMDGMERYDLPRTSEEWKELSITYGRFLATSTGETAHLQAHDAEFDAWVHVHAWIFLREAMRGNHLPIPTTEESTPSTEEMLKELRLTLTYSEIAELTGVPEVFIKGWARGGRATNSSWIEAIEKTYLARAE
jgi:oligoribonuclease (3'-5' exoribonuclease)